MAHVDGSSEVGSSASQQHGQEGQAPQAVASSTQGLVGSFKVVKQNNMDKIVKAAKDNIELQQLLLSQIDTYNLEKYKAQASGLTVSESVVIESRAKKSKTGAAAGDVPEISPTENIRRGQFYYTFWVKKLFHQALLFIDPTVFTNEFLKDVEIGTCKMLVEFGTGLRLHGDQLDKIATCNKLQTFTSMKALYVQNGRQWRDLVWSGYRVDFSGSNGFYSSENVGDKVMVTVKGIQDSVEFTSSISGSDPGPFVFIESNFSLQSAHFKTPRGEYKLCFLFPSLGRKLTRRPSDDVGATNGPPVPSRQVAEELAKEVLELAPREPLAEDDADVSAGEADGAAPQVAAAGVARNAVVNEEAPPPPP